MPTWLMASVTVGAVAVLVWKIVIGQSIDAVLWLFIAMMNVLNTWHWWSMRRRRGSAGQSGV